MGDRSTCPDCGAAILWVVMASGKRAPLEAEPDRRGTVLICDETDAELLNTTPGRAVALGPIDAIVERERGADLYRSHFASCPAAGRRRGSPR